MVLRKSWQKRVGALVMAGCAAASMTVMSSAVDAPKDGLGVTAGDVYTTYGGEVNLKYLFEVDPTSTTFKATAGGLFELSMKSGAASAQDNNSFRAYKQIDPSKSLNLMYSDPNTTNPKPQIFVTATDLTTSAFYVDMNLKNVTAEPEYQIEAVKRYGSLMVDMLKSNGKPEMLPYDKIAIENPTVKFVYPFTVHNAAEGVVAFNGNDYVDAQDTLTPAQKSVPRGSDLTSYVEYGKSTTFTITPNANFSIADVTVSVNGGAPTSIKDQVSINSQGVGTLEYAGISTMTGANDKYEINVTYGHEVKGIVNGGNGTIAIDDGALGTTVSAAVSHGTSTTFHMAPADQYCVDSAIVTGVMSGSTPYSIPKASLGADTGSTANNPKIYTVESVERNVVLTVTYAEDKNRNDIPDKYEVVFTFKTAGNGTIGGGTQDITVSKARLDSAGNYSSTASVKLDEQDVPEVAGSTGYMFDYWDMNGTPLKVLAQKAPAGTYQNNTTFTAHFAIGSGDYPDKYKMKFQFTADANGSITSDPNFIVKPKLSNPSDPTSFATNGTATLTTGDVATYGVNAPKTGYLFKCWKNVNTNQDLADDDLTAPAGNYQGNINATEMEVQEFQATYKNGTGNVYIPSTSATKIIKGAWATRPPMNETEAEATTTQIEFYLQVANSAATVEDLQKIEVSADVYRRTGENDYPGMVWTDFMGIVKNTDGTIKVEDGGVVNAVDGRTGTWRKGIITIGKNEAGVLKSGIVPFQVSYNDGTATHEVATCTVIVPGDTNRDGKFTAQDVVLMSMNISTPTLLPTVDANDPYFQALVDIDANGRSTAVDVTYVNMMVLGNLPMN